MVAIRQLSREEETQAAETLKQWAPLLNQALHRFCGAYGGDLEDMRQVGSVAVLRAVAEHDPLRPGGASLKTLVYTYVWTALRTLRRRDQGVVRVPIARRATESVCVLSMSVPIGPQERPWADVLAAPVVEDQAYEDELDMLEKAIKSLPARERKIIEGRFFQERTLADVGAGLGMGKERVRQVQNEALAMLRKRMTQAHHGAGLAAVKKRK